MKTKVFRVLVGAVGLWVLVGMMAGMLWLFSIAPSWFFPTFLAIALTSLVGAISMNSSGWKDKP